MLTARLILFLAFFLPLYVPPSQKAPIYPAYSVCQGLGELGRHLDQEVLREWFTDPVERACHYVYASTGKEDSNATSADTTTTSSSSSSSSSSPSSPPSSSSSSPSSSSSSNLDVAERVIWWGICVGLASTLFVVAGPSLVGLLGLVLFAGRPCEFGQLMSGFCVAFLGACCQAFYLFVLFDDSSSSFSSSSSSSRSSSRRKKQN